MTLQQHLVDTSHDPQVSVNLKNRSVCGNKPFRRWFCLFESTDVYHGRRRVGEEGKHVSIPKSEPKATRETLHATTCTGSTVVSTRPCRDRPDKSNAFPLHKLGRKKKKNAVYLPLILKPPNTVSNAFYASLSSSLSGADFLLDGYLRS